MHGHNLKLRMKTVSPRDVLRQLIVSTENVHVPPSLAPTIGVGDRLCDDARNHVTRPDTREHKSLSLVLLMKPSYRDTVGAW